MAKLSNKSIFYNAFSRFYDLSYYYWIPLRHTVSHDLAYLAEKFSIAQPECILCDSHIFVDLYKELAKCCGAKLIVNRCEGTLRRFHREFVQTYGLIDQQVWVQALVEKCGWITRKFFRYWRVIRYWEHYRATRAMITDSARITENVFNNYSPKETEIFYANAGLAVLEGYTDVFKQELEENKEIVLAPTIDILDKSLPRNIEEWLARQDPGRTVYVSFGTNIVLSEALLGELVRGFVDANVAVIWSLPRPQIDLLANRHLTGNFLIEEFLPQTAILASKNVGCFVTHGGAGSAQEAVICGKPVLCIPFLWDQPYNSSILVRLGVGRRLSKRHITWRRISREILELLDNQVYAEAARRLADDVGALQKSSQQSEWIYDVFPE